MLEHNIHLNKLSQVGGWLEQLGIKLISTQVVFEVEVGVELGNSSNVSKCFIFQKSSE